MPTQIGQWDSPVIGKVEDILETDGAKVIYMALIAWQPWLAGWYISWLVQFICNGVSKILVEGMDRAVYAGFVAIRIGKQVSDYVKEEQAGNESAADEAADHLIHVGDTKT